MGAIHRFGVSGVALIIGPLYLPDTPVVRADLARLYDNLAFDEAEVGRIMAALEEDGALDETIVIVASDHGDGLPRVKRAIYADGLGVPLMVRFPDRRGAGTASTRLFSFVDLAPTILSLARAPVPSWMHGRPFLGKARPRDYAFAAADRFDAMPDYSRTAIDGRYQYVRHYTTEPYFRPLPFRDALPTMQELWRLHRAGRLPPPAEQYFATPRAREELFDLTADAHTVRNLAADPARARDLARLRRTLDRWTRRTGDLSVLPERAMVERMWPGLKQPVTAPPQARVRRVGGEVEVRLHSPTPGASIGYRTDPASPWHLYVAPVRLTAGQTIEAKAIRYGFAESAIARKTAR